MLNRIAICVPARDEAAELPKLFAAIDRLKCHGVGQMHVCLLLDRCIDDSAAIAEQYRTRSKHRVWIKRLAWTGTNAGVARHQAMMLGVKAVGGSGLLLTTDADSAPASTWLGSMTAGLLQADVVTGRIVRDGGQPNLLQDRIETYYDGLFALRRRLDMVAWEAAITHHHTGGANLGIHSSAYRALGGFAPLQSGEDARLVDDAARAGLRVRRDAASVVHTSSRREGRAEGGLASLLRKLEGGDVGAVHVAHPADAAWQYRMHRQARAAHASGCFDRFAAAIGLSIDHVRGVARDCVNGEAFAMCIIPEPPGGMRRVALPVAEQELVKLTCLSEAA